MALSQTDFDYTPVRKARFRNWIPKKWRPEYERVVAYSATGMSNKVIAEKVGFTKEHVSNILNLPQAEALMERIVKAMNQRTMTDIPATLGRVAEKTVKRLETLLDDDAKFKDSPFAIIDRGMKVLEGLSHLKGGGNGSSGVTNNFPNALIIPIAQADNLTEGLKKANEVRLLHAPVVKDASNP